MNVRRYVEDLLRDRRPRALRASADDAAVLRTAIQLRAAGNQGAAPSPEFVADLERRLAGRREASPAPAAETRRRVLIGGSIAAAAAMGAGVAAALHSDPPTSSGGMMAADTGSWQTVGAAADLAEGGTTAFDVGSVRGFVHRRGGQLVAVSGVCTHQGCALRMDATAARLRCPCHTTSFTLDGTVVMHELPRAPAPLPHLPVRESGGSIQIFAP